MKRVGIVGCGGIAGTHAWALGQMTDVELVGFADIIQERAVNFSKNYSDGHAGYFGSLTDMLENCRLDVLHVCTPHYLHVPMIIEALDKGISVFSEKPPAINMEQFSHLERVLEGKAGVTPRIGFCFQNRYNKTIEKTDEILEEGNLGQVVGARAFVTWRRDEDYYRTDWKGRLATEGGGALINQSIHTLDLILRYLGRPLDVQATVSNHHLQGVIEVEDTVEAHLSFEKGKRACFYASTGYITDAPIIFELQCEKGSITIINQEVTVRRKRKAGSEYEKGLNTAKAGTEDNGVITYFMEEKKGMGKDYWGNGHLTCIRDFYDKLDSGARFQNDLEGVKNTMETMMRIYQYR